MKTLRDTGCNKGRVASGSIQTYIGPAIAYSLSASFCASFVFSEKAS